MEQHWQNLVTVATTREACIAIEAIQARVAELEAGEKHYQTRLARIASMAGNPDPAQACRLIIQAATEPV